MQPNERAEFVRILNGLAAVKPGAASGLTSEALDIWWLSVGAKWSLPDFRSAAAHLVTACQFMPTPYDFEQLRKASEPTAHEAWSQVISGSINWRCPEKLPNGRIARAAQCVGGFRAIAMADTERDLPHIQRRFLEAYEQLSDVESVREALPQIAQKINKQKPGLLPVLDWD